MAKMKVHELAKELNINEYYWGLNSKFKLEVGVKNKIDSNYPDIIWFPQGMYIFTSFSKIFMNT